MESADGLSVALAGGDARVGSTSHRSVCNRACSTRVASLESEALAYMIIC